MGYVRRRRAGRRSAEGGRDGRRVGHGRRVRRPCRRRAGPRQPPGRRHVRRPRIRSSPPTRSTRSIDEYVNENLEIKLRSTQGMLDWLDNELANQQKRVEESERALAEYREKENALSLDDKQNIVLSRLNQLNDTATRARSSRVQKESLYNQVKVDRQRHESGRDSRSSRTNAGVQDRKDQAGRAAAAEGPAARALRRQASRRCSTSTRSSTTRSGSSTSPSPARSSRCATSTRRRVHRGADVREEPRRRQERGDRPEPQGHRLRRDGARGQEQPRGLPVAADAREGTARLRQQPHQQRARGRPRRDPAGADHAGRPPHLADVGA